MFYKSCVRSKDFIIEKNNTIYIHRIYFICCVHQKHSTSYKTEITQTKDKRITGYKEVDGFIIDIVDILIEDYVTSWYGLITMDSEFTYAIKSAALESASSISYR